MADAGQRRVPDRQGLCADPSISHSRGAPPRSAHPSPAVARPTDRARKPLLHAPLTSPLDNKLLAALPRRDFDMLAAHLTASSLAQGDVVYEAGAEVDHVYFPH